MTEPTLAQEQRAQELIQEAFADEARRCLLVVDNKIKGEELEHLRKRETDEWLSDGVAADEKELAHKCLMIVMLTIGDQLLTLLDRKQRDKHKQIIAKWRKAVKDKQERHNGL